MSFNPHTHAGCDSRCSYEKTDSDCFNPHTHAGCDTLPTMSSVWLISFNPHTHAGCDSNRFKAQCRLTVFQSTHPRRVWLMITPCCVIYSSFQSTHPRRVWHVIQQTIWKKYQFQSTHPRRVWPAVPAAGHLYAGFNPHTHAGCDHRQGLPPVKNMVSIHTPTQGVTLYLITYYKSANLIHCYANHHYYSTS